MRVSDPKKMEGRASPWLVTSSINGKRIRKFFKSYQLALRYREDVLNGAKEVGEKNLLLDPKQLSDYQMAASLLPEGVTLTEAVSQWLAWGGRSLTGVKIKDALMRFWRRLEDRNLSKGTYTGYSHCHKNILEVFGERDAGEDISKDLEALFFKWLHEETYSWKSIKRHHAYLSSFYSWAIRERISRDNWCKYVELAKEPKVKKEFLTADEAEELLRLCQKYDPGLISYLVLGLFAGLRPMEIRDAYSSTTLFQWKQIDFDAQSISVMEAKDVNHNNSTRRFVESLPGKGLVFQWLQAYEEYQLELKNLRKRLDKIRDKMGMTKRLGSLFRKSFATHAVPLQGVAQTALQMGHTNTSTTEKHYKGLVTNAEGWKYFSILP